MSRVIIDVLQLVDGRGSSGLQLCRLVQPVVLVHGNKVYFYIRYES
jgi:hypothetical protein